MASEESKKLRAELTPDDVQSIRSEIVARVVQEMKVGNFANQMMASGYTQSEGKNYGSYNRE